jgi:hypothetical protein
MQKSTFIEDISFNLSIIQSILFLDGFFYRVMLEGAHSVLVSKSGSASEIASAQEIS